MLDMTPDQIEALRTWAERRPPISRAWVFGSRAKGTADPDSDIDVAVEVEPKPGMTPHQTVEEMGLAWLGWEFDLTKALGTDNIQLELLDPDRTPNTAAGVREAGVEVFDRSEAARDG